MRYAPLDTSQKSQNGLDYDLVQWESSVQAKSIVSKNGRLSSYDATIEVESSQRDAIESSQNEVSETNPTNVNEPEGEDDHITQCSHVSSQAKPVDSD